MQTTEFKTKNLAALRDLRTQEKVLKARIDEISGKATEEAVAILAEKGQEKGEFEVKALVSSNCNAPRFSTLPITTSTNRNRR